MSRRPERPIVPLPQYEEIFSNWEDAKAYPNEHSSPDHWCWELLRRNPDFQRDCILSEEAMKEKLYFTQRICVARPQGSPIVYSSSESSRNGHHPVTPFLWLQSKWGFYLQEMSPSLLPLLEFNEEISFFDSSHPNVYTASNSGEAEAAMALSEMKKMDDAVEEVLDHGFDLPLYCHEEETPFEMDRDRLYELSLNLRGGNVLFELDPLGDIDRQIERIVQIAKQERRDLIKTYKDNGFLDGRSDPRDELHKYLRIFDARVCEHENQSMTGYKIHNIVTGEGEIRPGDKIKRALSGIERWLKDPILLKIKLSI